jgi:hypothetical protein
MHLISLSQKYLSWCRSSLIVFHFTGIVSMHLISWSFIPSPRLSNRVDVCLAFVIILLQLYVNVVHLYIMRFFMLGFPCLVSD